MNRAEGLAHATTSDRSPDPKLSEVSTPQVWGMTEWLTPDPSGQKLLSDLPLTSEQPEKGRNAESTHITVLGPSSQYTDARATVNR